MDLPKHLRRGDRSFAILDGLDILGGLGGLGGLDGLGFMGIFCFVMRCGVRG